MFREKSTAWILILIIVFISFFPNTYAGRILDYEVNKSPDGISYQKNDDGNDTVTLVECRARKKIDIISPVGNPVTRVNANFAGGKNSSKLSAVEVMQILAKNTGILLKDTATGAASILVNILKTLGYGTAFIVRNAGKAIVNGFMIGGTMLCPFLNIFMAAAMANSNEGFDMVRIYKWNEYSRYEPNYYKLPEFNYFKLSKSANNICAVYLDECLSVGEYAFSNCKKLQKVSLPKCKEFGDCVFSNCDSLENISLPSCTDLPYCAFENCKNLEHIDLDNCEVMSNLCFKNCEKLSYIYAPNCKNIEKSAFEGCTALKELVVSRDCRFAEDAISEEKIKVGCVKYAPDAAGGSGVSMSVDEFKSSSVAKKDENEAVFDAVDSESGIMVHADKNVFPKGAKLSVKKIVFKDVMTKDEYKDLIKNLDGKYRGQIEKISMWDIKIVDENGESVHPNGMAKIMYPIDENMNEEDLKSLRVNENKDTNFEYEITEVGGRKYCSYYVDHFSFYCLIDTFSVEDMWEYLFPYSVGIATLFLIAWGVYSALKKNESYLN